MKSMFFKRMFAEKVNWLEAVCRIPEVHYRNFYPYSNFPHPASRFQPSNNSSPQSYKRPEASASYILQGRASFFR